MRIYLEEKPVVIGKDTGYFHLYLVRRPDPPPRAIPTAAFRGARAGRYCAVGRKAGLAH